MLHRSFLNDLLHGSVNLCIFMYAVFSVPVASITADVDLQAVFFAYLPSSVALKYVMLLKSEIIRVCVSAAYKTMLSVFLYDAVHYYCPPTNIP